MTTSHHWLRDKLLHRSLARLHVEKNGSPETQHSLGHDPGRGACFSEPTEPTVAVSRPTNPSTVLSNLIGGDETVILLLKPSPAYVVLSCMGTLALLGAIGMGGVWAQRQFEAQWFDEQAMLILCFILAGMRILWQFLEWTSRTYILTDRRVIRTMGILRVQIFQAELRRLRKPTLLFTARERLLGLGTIAFSTTGHTEAYWVMIAHPQQVHETVLQAMHRYGR